MWHADIVPSLLAALAQPADPRGQDQRPIVTAQVAPLIELKCASQAAPGSFDRDPQRAGSEYPASTASM
jgi:hypothetical protein